jgi:hypothetical protein
MMRRTALRAKSHYKPVELRRFHDWIADHGCLVCGFEAIVHHVRGYGDKPGSISKDDWLVTPLCPRHHDIQHGPRESVHALGHQGFFQTYGIDLLAEAMSFAEQWQRRDAA